MPKVRRYYDWLDRIHGPVEAQVAGAHGLATAFRANLREPRQQPLPPKHGESNYRSAQIANLEL